MSGAETETSQQQPEILPSQLAVKQLADEMLELRRPDVDMSIMRLNVDIPPAELESLLSSYSFSDLLLKEGDSLSADPPDKYWTDLNLYIGQAKPFATEIRAWGADMDSEQKLVILGGDEPVMIWGRQLEVKVWYTNGDQTAGQAIGVQTWSYHGDTPRFHRSVSAPAYAEMGYEGHNNKVRDAENEQEVLDFTELVRRLFEKRAGKH
jgi:hypothetical protein